MAASAILARTYPNSIKERIRQRGLTIKYVAQQIDLPERTMSDYVRGCVPVPRDILQRIADCIGCSVEELEIKRWNVPHQRNPFFTGREDLLNQLHGALLKTKAVAMTHMQAVCGLGGIGKTQIAIEYAYRYRNEYQAVLWVKADTSESILSDFLSIAGVLSLPEQEAQDQAVIVAAIKRWMREQKDWLLVFDNADNLALLKNFIPSGHRGHILLTTRAQSMGGLAHRIDVNTMSTEVGALFLLRRANILAPDASLGKASPTHRDIAFEIVRALGGLPLALDQAGAYIEECSCSLQEYLFLYRKQRTTLLKRRGGLVFDHPEPVATTWTLSFERIERASSVAAELLHLCAFLDPDAIPEEIITAGAFYLGPALQSVANDPFALDRAVEELNKFSLVRRNPDTSMLTIHRLVQVSVQDAMDEMTQRVWAERTIQSVNATFPSEVTVAVWQHCQRLLPHVQVCAMLVEQYSLTLPEAATLFNQAGYYLRERALYSEAESLYREALVIREKIFGSYHPGTAQVLYNLARLYFELGQYAECEVFYLRALAIREQILPPNHLDIALSLNSLAFMYYLWGVKYDEAEKLFQRALTIFDRAIGMEHPKTAHCLSNLALLYATQGKYAEAEHLLLRVQAIRDRFLGHLHLDTARSLQNLAWLYIDQGKQERFEEARRLLEDSLEIRETLLGSEHPQTANSLYHLATLYEAWGQYSEAEQFYRRVLTIRRKMMMGGDNPKVLLTEKSYAALLRKMDRFEEARQLERHIQAVQNHL